MRRLAAVVVLLLPACVDQTGLSEHPSTVIDRGLVIVQSMAVTPVGEVHVSYFIITDGNANHGQFRYAMCDRACTFLGSWQRGVLDMGELAAGPDGAVHAARTLATGGFVYARCVADCTTRASWDTAVVDAGADTGTIVGLTADRVGRLHVLYTIGATMKYATCTSGCTAPPSWTVGLGPDSTRAAGVGALVAGAAGDLHVAYLDPDSATLADTIAGTFPMEMMYGACSSACTSASSWHLVSLGTAGVPLGGASRRTPALAVDRGGRLHLAYLSGTLFQPRVSYATCAANCGAATAWTTVVADSVNLFGNVALAASPVGPIAMSYPSGIAGRLRYATCVGACSDTSHWTRETLPGAFADAVRLGFDRSGAPRIMFTNVNGELRYVH